MRMWRGGRESASKHNPTGLTDILHRVGCEAGACLTSRRGAGGGCLDAERRQPPPSERGMRPASVVVDMPYLDDPYVFPVGPRISRCSSIRS